MCLRIDKLDQMLSGIFNVTSKCPQHMHAAIKGAKTFISQDRAHAKQLLFAVDIHSVIDFFLFPVDAASATAVARIFQAIVWSECTNLLLIDLLVDDLGEEQHVGPDESTVRLPDLEEQNKVV